MRVRNAPSGCRSRGRSATILRIVSSRSKSQARRRAAPRPHRPRRRPGCRTREHGGFRCGGAIPWAARIRRPHNNQTAAARNLFPQPPTQLVGVEAGFMLRTYVHLLATDLPRPDFRGQLGGNTSGRNAPNRRGRGGRCSRRVGRVSPAEPGRDASGELVMKGSAVRIRASALAQAQPRAAPLQARLPLTAAVRTRAVSSGSRSGRAYDPIASRRWMWKP
jgi:hypothetical protein